MPVFSTKSIHELLLDLIGDDFASVSCKIQLVHEKDCFQLMMKE